ncbi:Hypothetical predicted protein [Olea europaea subsp. europaea]|uniref:Uncharacterized protein n=1 Tax=Olea europaea subsp. europaea TaxID=158383 RepID=A0A8S0R7A6_OLEEU|nr:Hypothetical predicted protein [Olea europaea subsp. europaea]
MRRYLGHDYKQVSYVYVEEDNFIKGDYVKDNGSRIHMMKPNQWIPTLPHNHHALPNHGVIMRYACEREHHPDHYEGKKDDNYWNFKGIND